LPYAYLASIQVAFLQRFFWLHPPQRKAVLPRVSSDSCHEGPVLTRFRPRGIRFAGILPLRGHYVRQTKKAPEGAFLVCYAIAAPVGARCLPPDGKQAPKEATARSCRNALR